MACVLACDLGGASFRAALVDDAGQVTHLATVPLPLGLDEVDPEVWWLTFQTGVATVADAAGAAFEDVAAIGISAFTRTQVFLGRGGKVVRPAMTWRDTRAETLMPALRAALPSDHPETAAISAFHPLARLYWLARHEPVALDELEAVVDPKDYLNFRLTGRIASDTVAGARLIASASLLTAAGLPPGIVPDAVAPTDVVGTVARGLPGVLGRLAGRPVMAMANDTWAAVLGLGALRPGYGYNLSGTTEVLGVLNDVAGPAEGLLTVDWGQGVVQVGGPSQNGADTLAWLADLIRGPDTDANIGVLLDAVLAGRRAAQPALFLPYLQGERTPYWDPSLRGAFIGLNRGHRPTDIAFAVLEGVAFLNRIVLDRAEQAAGRQVDEIRFGGGGAANARWCQIKADVMDRPIVVVDEAEPGLVGVAIVAFAALGRVPDIAAGQALLVRPRMRFEPRSAAVAFYRDLFPLYRAAEAALAPISRQLAGRAMPTFS